jgi:SMC interacting uncharacterized protein involved in chromosome segregation
MKERKLQDAIDPEIWQGLPQTIQEKVNRFDREYRQELAERHERIEAKAQSLEDKIDNLTDTITDQQKELQAFKESTKDLLEAFRNIQGLINIIKFIGGIAKPLIVCAGAVTAFFMYFQGIKIK